MADSILFLGSWLNFNIDGFLYDGIVERVAVARANEHKHPIVDGECDVLEFAGHTRDIAHRVNSLDRCFVGSIGIE